MIKVFRFNISFFQFSDIPEDYDKTFLSLSRRGARVLALGVKTLGSMNPSKAKELSRDSLECDLRFAGFIGNSDF